MDSNNATILALALGIPCATVLPIACLLTLRISHRQLLACRIRNPTVPTNSPAPSPPPVDPYYGIPLEQRPPRILAPLPRRPISIDDLARAAGQEAVDGGISRSVSTEVPEGNPPTPPRRRQPIIVLSPSNTAAESPSINPSPSPGKYGHYRNNGRGFDVGRDIRVTAPSTHDSTWDANPTAPSAQLAQVSSGIISLFPSAPISQRPATAHPSTEHLPHQQVLSDIEERRQSGRALSRSTTGNSTHSSLYRQSRNPSPVPHASQSPKVTTAVTGQMRSSSVQDVELEFTAGTGRESTDSSGQSRNLHQSYSRPMSRNTMSISLTRQQEKAPSRNTPSTRHTDPNNPRCRNNFRVDPRAAAVDRRPRLYQR